MHATRCGVYSDQFSDQSVCKLVRSITLYPLGHIHNIWYAYISRQDGVSHPRTDVYLFTLVPLNGLCKGKLVR